MEAASLACPQCGHRCILPGRLIPKRGGKPIVGEWSFRFETNIVIASGWKRFFGWKIHFTISSDFFLCIDCGLNWNSLDPKQIQKAIQELASEDVRQGLGLVGEKSHLADDLA